MLFKQSSKLSSICFRYYFLRIGSPKREIDRNSPAFIRRRSLSADTGPQNYFKQGSDFSPRASISLRSKLLTSGVSSAPLVFGASITQPPRTDFFYPGSANLREFSVAAGSPASVASRSDSGSLGARSEPVSSGSESISLASLSERISLASHSEAEAIDTTIEEVS